MIDLGRAYACFPDEMKRLPQWCIAAPDKSPYTVNSSGAAYRASASDPRTWLSFEVAIHYAQAWGVRVGFMMSETDPYTVVDIDVKNAVNEADSSKWTSPEQISHFDKIRRRLDSYTERSISGQGLHIFTLATVGEGKRFGGIEIYDRARFIICTGDSIGRPDIVNRQETIDEMLSVIRAQQSKVVGDEFSIWAFKKYDVDEDDEIFTDSEIYEMGCAAENGAKFKTLSDGMWAELGYQSQSEADISFLNMLAFYSNSNEQCRRMFRQSKLGKREKAQRDDYLNRTIRRFRGEQEHKFKEHAEMAAMLAPQVQAMQAQLDAIVKTGDHFAKPENNPIPAEACAPIESPNLPWPPGLTGKLAQYIAASAFLPVPEYAIATALAMLAGICGKAWGISGSGLNLYLVMVGDSGTGKESANDSIGRFINLLQPKAPRVSEFFEFSNMASGQALGKKIVGCPSFVLIYGEWGKTLRMINEGTNQSLQSFRQKLLDIYQKNTSSAIVGGSRRVSTEDSVVSVSGVAMSFLGETNPHDYYTAMSGGEAADGFLSRFTVIEYIGDRMNENKDRAVHANPPEWMQDWVAALVNTASGYITSNNQVNVPARADAQELLREYAEEATKKINNYKGHEVEPLRQLWIRAHLKVLKLSALMAIADNMTLPCIQIEHVQWAINLIQKDIETYQKREEEGAIGFGDAACQNRIQIICKEYLTRKPSPGYKVPDGLFNHNVIPRRYLQMRTQTSPQFVKSRMGSSAAMDKAISNMVQNGQLEEVPMSVVKEMIGSGIGKCYRIVNVS